MNINSCNKIKKKHKEIENVSGYLLKEKKRFKFILQCENNPCQERRDDRDNKFYCDLNKL